MPHFPRALALISTLTAFLIHPALAQWSLSDPSSSPIITFDTTIPGVGNGAFAGDGFQPNTSTAGRLDSNAWSVTGLSDGSLAFGGTQIATSPRNDFTRGIRTDPVTTGGIYAFGGGSINGYALGLQQTDPDATPGSVVLRMQNNTGSVISAFSVDYVIHVRNDDFRSQSIKFAHSPDHVTYATVPALDLATTEAGSFTANFEATYRRIHLSGLSIAPGASYHFRWTFDDIGGFGGRDEIALDDIRISDIQGAGFAFNHWDPTGTAPGLGGSGVWSPSVPAWNSNSGGIDPLAISNPAQRMVFAGNSGTVTMEPGAEANAGIEFLSDAYLLTGAPLTLGGNYPAIRVANAGHVAVIDAPIQGTNGLRKTGPGRLILNATSTYTGPTTLTEGTLEIADDAHLGASTAPIAFQGGTLRVSSSMTLPASRPLSGDARFDIPEGSILTIAGTPSIVPFILRNLGVLEFAGATAATPGLVFEQAGEVRATTATLALTGPLTTTHTTGTAQVTAPLQLGNTTRTVTVADGSAAVDLRLAGAVSTSTTAGRLQKLGDGTLEITGSMAGYLGSIQIGKADSTPAAGGTYIASTADALGAGPLALHNGTLHAATPLTFANAVQLSGGQVGAGSRFAGNPMVFNGSAALNRPSATFFQYKLTADTDVTFAGGLNVSSGSGLVNGFTIGGSGRVILPNSTNTIAEATNVDGGHLVVAGSFSGALTIRNGGTLSGLTNTGAETGERLSAVTIGMNGILSPGLDADPAGTLHTGNLALQTQGTLRANLSAPTIGEFDQINVTGTVTLGGTLQLQLSGYQPIEGDAFSLILNDGTDQVTGTFAGIADGVEFFVDGFAFTLDYQGGDGNDVVLTALPEPGSAVFLLVGATLAARRRRRR